MARVSPRFFEDAARYLLGRGDYPYSCSVRTPVGPISIRLDSHHDMITVNEMFCRLDYRVDRSARTIVDVGSNIGVSALYFLTRTNARLWLYEPVPRNIERLRENLQPFETRYTLNEVAVAPFSGTASFSIEQSGRYGGLAREYADSIEVRVVDINTVLTDVLRDNPVIDVLKVDTEGTEYEIVTAIDRELLPRIRTIYFETFDMDEEPEPVFPDLFDHHARNETVRLTNRALAGSSTRR
jgi:FkbM family methyltransferase